jgi:hypothetical protein
MKPWELIRIFPNELIKINIRKRNFPHKFHCEQIVLMQININNYNNPENDREKWYLCNMCICSCSHSFFPKHFLMHFGISMICERNNERNCKIKTNFNFYCNCIKIKQIMLYWSDRVLYTCCCCCCHNAWLACSSPLQYYFFSFTAMCIFMCIFIYGWDWTVFDSSICNNKFFIAFIVSMGKIIMSRFEWMRWIELDDLRGFHVKWFEFYFLANNHFLSGLEMKSHCCPNQRIKNWINWFYRNIIIIMWWVLLKF